MRILNRPMFKYGGPIKEGIMHGMKNGGLSKQFNTGLVGDERYPQTGGREHHGFFLPALYTAGRMLARPFAKQVMKQVPKFTKVRWQKPGNIYSKGYPGGSGKGGWQNLGPSKETMKVSEWQPTKFGKWFQGDPMAGAVMSGKGFVGGAAKKGLQFGKYATTTPSGLLFFGAPVTIAGTKWLLSDGTELNEEQKRQVKQEGPPGGGETALGSREAYYEKPPVTKSAEELAAEAKAARTKKLNKYLDTMGYDKAKKTAMGDALIDASAIVQDATSEAGSLKKADWGKMINKAIQSTSKRLDKPDQIREAVGLMLTKSEIEKDMEDPQTKELRRLQIKGAEKALAGKTTAELIQERMLKGDYPSGKNLARLVSLNNPGANIKVIPSTGMDVDVDTIDYITEVVANANESGKPFPPGVYVIKDRIIQVDETGTVTPIPISALK